MLNELFGKRDCPVCGRHFAFPVTGWWCPLCGASFSDEITDKGTTPPRITKRDEEGAVQYIGEYGFTSPCYVGELSLTAMLDIIERLCRWEEGYYTRNEEDK